VNGIRLAMIDAAVVLVSTAGSRRVALGSQGHMAGVGIVRMMMRVSCAAVTVGVRVVVRRMVVRM
jgi:hypothetical protein